MLRKSLISLVGSLMLFATSAARADHEVFASDPQVRLGLDIVWGNRWSPPVYYGPPPVYYGEHYAWRPAPPPHRHWRGHRPRGNAWGYYSHNDNHHRRYDDHDYRRDGDRGHYDRGYDRGRDDGDRHRGNNQRRHRH
jgi:hypothetical protein